MPKREQDLRAEVQNEREESLKVRTGGVRRKSLWNKREGSEVEFAHASIPHEQIVKAFS